MKIEGDCFSILKQFFLLIELPYYSMIKESFLKFN